MPTPRSDEERQAFISRFMADPAMQREYPTTNQRLAVAYRQWSDRRRLSRSGLEVIESTYERALAAARSGHVDHGEWSAPEGSQRTAEDCLARDPEQKGTADEFHYPLFSGGKLSARGVGNALARARQHAPVLVAKLEKIDNAIHQHMSRLVLFASSPAQALAAVTMDTFPKSVNGLPASYFWRQSICDGTFTHPQMGFTVKVTPERRRQWEESFRKMRRNGVEVPIVEDHSESAAKTLGYVMDVRQRDGWFEELHQYIGDTARERALKNRVSVQIVPDFVDGHGRHYGDAITHSAITPVPVVPGQGQPVSLSAASSPDQGCIVLELAATEDPQIRSITMPTCSVSPEQLSRFQSLVDDGITAETLIDRLLSSLEARHAADIEELGGNEAVANLSRSDISDRATQQRRSNRTVAQQLSVAQAELASTKQKVADLSARLPAALGDEAQSALLDAVKVKQQLCVAKGAVSPSVAERLYAALARTPDGKVNTLALSRAANPIGNRALALDLFDILTDNQPVAIGDRTGVQTLARIDPDSEVSPEQRRKAAAAKLFNAYLAGGKSQD